MAKTPLKVTISKGRLSKDIPKAQWDSMVASKATYGWSLSSNIPDEVLQKEKQIQNSQDSKYLKEISDLKDANKKMGDHLKELAIKVSIKEDEIQNLKHRLASKAEPQQSDNGQDISLESSTRAQLDEVAKSKGIDPSKFRTKSDIIAAIKN
jgi:hypothetical protein